MKTEQITLFGVVSALVASAVIALVAVGVLREQRRESMRVEALIELTDKAQALHVLTAAFREEWGQSDARQAKEVLGSMEKLLKIAARSPREQVLIGQLQRNGRELGPLMDQWFAPGQGGSGAERERRQMLTSQIWTKVQFISDDANRLRDLSELRVMAGQKKTAVIIAVLIVVLALTNIGIYLLTVRSLMRAQAEVRSVALFPEENPFPVLRVKEDATLLYANGSAGAVLESWGCGVGERVPEFVRELMGRARESGGKQETEWCVGERTFLFVAMPIRERKYLNLYGRDVTERKLAEEKLRESEERFRSYFELGLIGMAITSPEKGWLEVNDEICAILGYDRSELLQKTWAELTHPDDLAADVAQFNRIVAGEIDGYTLDKRFLRKDGRVVCATLSGRCLRRADHSVNYIVVLLQDITERKRAEEELRESRGRLEAFAAAAFEGIVESEDGRIVDCNEQFADMSGWSLAELRGMNVRDLVSPGDWERVIGNVENNRESVVEHGMVRKDGTGLVVEARGRPTALGGPRRYTAVRDLTERKRAEEAVRRKVEELSAVLDAAPVAIWMAQDADCRVITGNAYADELIMGTKRGGNISRSAREGEAAVTYRVFREGAELRPDELPAQRATATGETVPAFEMELVFPDGRKVSLLAGAVPLFDGKRKVRGAIVAGLDVTPLRKAQEEVRESEEHFRSITDTTPVIMWMTDATGAMEFVNREYRQFFGVTLEQVAGTGKWQPLVHPEDVEQYTGAFSRALVERGEFVAEARVRRADGEWRWVQSYGAPRFDERGEFLGIAGSSPDITERKQAEEALRESEERLAQATAVAGLGTFEHDHVSGAVEYSPVLRELMGFGPEEKVTLAGIMEKVVPEDRERMVEAVRRAHDPAGDGVFAMDHRVRDTEGRVRWISVRSHTSFEGEGSGRRPVRTIGAGLDVTERKEAEAELERLVAERTAKLQELVGELEHFSYTITHDLKSPLRAMRGFAEMMNMMACASCVQTQAKDFLGRITTSAERMDKLIADALSYSRSVRQELPLEEVDAGALLRGMLDSYPELQAEKAGIRVEGRLPVVLANEAGLTQVFSNLLGNAVKFVKRGQKPEIRVWAQESKSDVRSQKSEGNAKETRSGGRPGSGWVRIWVEDNGIGISKEMMPRVFDMFARASKDYEGTGIGLALVRKVVHRMGGKVGLESEEGRGSRFWIELPKAEPANGFAVAAGAPRGAAGEGTVLYVEDEESDAIFMEQAFERKGLAGKLRVVRDGRAAMDYLSGAGSYCDREEYPVPALVLLDVNLPQIPGFEVLEWIRNNPDYARMPVVVFSSSTREDDRLTAKELGADEFVAKPSSGLKFGEVVEGLQRKWLQARRAGG